MEKLFILLFGAVLVIFSVLHLISILLICKTRKEVAKYIHYIEKFESEKPVSKKYLVFASSYRECEKVWANSRFSRGLPKTAAEFITFDNCPAAVKPYWNDVHFKRITLIGITLREFDKLYYGE